MCKICPKCGSIAEYNAYYGRTTCTSCEWESKPNNCSTIKRSSFDTSQKRRLKIKSNMLVKAGSR